MGRVVVVNGIVRGSLVDGGVQLLGYFSSVLSLAGGNSGLEMLEVRLDGRLPTQILQTLTLGYKDPLALLLRVSQSSFLQSSLQSPSSLA
jgi:hypothetical protein